MRMEQLSQQNAQEKSLIRISGGKEHPSRLGKERFFKDVKNLLRLKIEIDDNRIKSIRNLFRVTK